MAELTPLCEGLAVFGDRRVTTVIAHDEPVATFVAPDDDRPDLINVALVLPTGRAQDISLHPRTVGRRLRAEARRCRRDPNRWVTVLAVFLASRYAHHADPADDHDLDSICAQLPFPIVRQAVAAGAGAPPFVPAWAAPALRTATIDEAIEHLFDRPVNRGLRRSARLGLMTGVDAGGELDLTPLGLASTMPADWPVDHVASVAAGKGWLPPEAWPTVEQRSDFRRAWRHVPAPIGSRLCLSALESPTGLSELWSGLRLCETVLANGHPAPTSVAGLHELACTEADRHGLPDRRDDTPALRAAARVGPPPARRGWQFPVSIELILGYRSGSIRFELPRTRNDLSRWGETLGNCLADYGDAVAEGRTFIAGLFEGDSLVGALELGRDMTVLQLEGSRNRPPTEEQQAACRAMLEDLGLGSER